MYFNIVKSKYKVYHHLGEEIWGNLFLKKSASRIKLVRALLDNYRYSLFSKSYKASRIFKFQLARKALPFSEFFVAYYSLREKYFNTRFLKTFSSSSASFISFTPFFSLFLLSFCSLYVNKSFKLNIVNKIYFPGTFFPASVLFFLPKRHLSLKFFFETARLFVLTNRLRKRNKKRDVIFFSVKAGRRFKKRFPRKAPFRLKFRRLKLALYFGFTRYKFYTNFLKNFYKKGNNLGYVLSNLELRVGILLFRLGFFNNVYALKNLFKTSFVYLNGVPSSDFHQRFRSGDLVALPPILNKLRLNLFYYRFLNKVFLPVYKKKRSFLFLRKRSKKIFLFIPSYLEVDYKLGLSIAFRDPQLKDIISPLGQSSKFFFASLK